LEDVAEERGMPFVDLFDWKPGGRVTDISDNGIHLTPEGYRLMALEVARQLGWSTPVQSARKRAVENLRQAIIQKNQLYFDRWRPENETYLFGFRKNEQGQNAREIPEFDPLVDAADKQIFELQALKKRARAKSPRPSPRKIPGPLAMPDFEVAPGFQVSLWASDPMLAKPTQMNFDPKGRLWVATSSIYPQIAPGQKANDKIIVLQDTYGVGRADKSTVYASGLFIPTGVEPGDGGCYVGQGTELLHFSPEGRRVVLSGFGTEDTHHLVHTLCWGPDGMLYFNQSIYIHTHIETPHGVVHLNSGGVFQLRPATMQLDVFLRGFCNPWGHQFDEFGQSFVTDGAGYEGISWGIPGATYFSYAEMRRELPSISPGQYPKFCGLDIVADGQFPDDWQGNFLTADFRAHRIARFAVAEDGAGYVSKELPDLLRTTNATFRPVDLKFGPDGALYVADWCNPIINHGEVDFRDPRRDHDHGRIWRITAKGRPLLRRHDWTHARTTRLLRELLSTNSYDVQQARRVLTERGKSIEPALEYWTLRQKDEKALLQALWMYQSIDSRNDPLLDRLLEARDGHVRAAATRVLAAWPEAEGGEPADFYFRALQDPFPRVRVEALRAIARIPSLSAAQAALNTLKPNMDPFENYALWLTINDLAGPWLEAVKSGTWDIATHPDQFKFAMDAIDPALIERSLTGVLERQPISRSGSGPWIELIGRAGGAEAVQKLYNKILSGGFDKSAAARVWTALDEAAVRNIKPATQTEKVSYFFAAPEEKTRIAAIRLAGRWKTGGESLSNLLSLAAQTNASSAVRSEIFEALRRIGGETTLAALKPLTLRVEPLEIRRPAILTLAAIDVTNAAGPAISLLMDSTNQDSALSTWRSLLGTAGIGPVIAGAIPHTGFPEYLGKAGLRAVREGGNADPELVLALTRASGLEGRSTELTKKEMARLLDAVTKKGDAARGERIFRRAQQNCLSCHAIGGVGGNVGPDLTSIGASAQQDYLVDSVLYPNKDIKEGFQAFLIDTKDGEATAGIPVRENDQELVLRTAADQDVSIPRDQIVSRKPGGSLMPSGLTDNLNHQEQLDLFRFLSELGKPGPFDAARGDVARLWKIAPEGSNSWHKAYSLVDGRLLRADLENAAGVSDGVILAAARFRTVKGGPIHFNVSPPDGVALVIDGKESSAATALNAGEHTIALRMRADKLPEFIKLQSEDGTFLVK
jgi:putative heme-binding domain-containing protein